RAHLASGPDASPSGFEVVLHRHQGPVDVQALEVREAASPRDDAVEEPRGPIGPLPAVVGPGLGRSRLRAEIFELIGPSGTAALEYGAAQYGPAHGEGEPSARLRLDDHALGQPRRRSPTVAALEVLSDFERSDR